MTQSVGGPSGSSSKEPVKLPAFLRPIDKAIRKLGAKIREIRTAIENQDVEPSLRMAQITHLNATKAKADAGDKNAQYDLGRMYYSGEVFAANKYTYAQLALNEGRKGSQHSYEKAFIYLDKAAEQGHVGAKLLLGRMYFKGLGVPQDYSKAKECLQPLVEKNLIAKVLLDQILEAEKNH